MLRDRLQGGVALGGILAWVVMAGMGCGNDASVTAPVAPAVGGDVAVIQDADMVMRMDWQGMRDSAIYAKMKSMVDEHPDASAQIRDMEQVAEAIKEIVGLEEEDFLMVTFSASLEGVDLEGPNLDETMNAVMAIELAKPLSLEQIEEALRKVSAESPDANLVLNRQRHAGNDLLAVTMIDEHADETTLGVALTAYGRVVLAGTLTGTRGALDRAASGVIFSVVERLGLDPHALPHVAFRFDLTDAMKTQMRESLADPDPRDMMAGSMKVFESLERVDLKVDMADAMNLAFSMGLGTEEKAAAAKHVLDNTVLGMVRMMAGMMSGGQPLTVLDSLATRLDPNGMVTLSFTLSAADLEILQSLNP